MNRRDIIITAVLINAGLLIILFTTSLKSKDPHEIALREVPKKEVVEVAVKPPPVKPVKVAPPQPKVEPAPKPKVVKNVTPEKKESKVASLPPAPPVEEKAPIPVMLVEVQPGDALEKLAKHYNVTVDEIMKINSLEDSRLKIGQKLQIPVATPKKEAPKPQNSAYEYYTVKNGDNPWTIAVKNHMKVDDLLKLNNLDENKARRLKPGDQLRIR